MRRKWSHQRYALTAGSSVQIPLTGWSDRATGDWVLDAEVFTTNATNPGDVLVSLSSATTYATDAGAFPTTNNGRTSTLTVSAPGTPSGTWATIGIYSQPLVYSGDPWELWVVGVYIP